MPHQPSGFASSGHSYSELVKESLKAATMEHGLQTTSIYAEAGGHSNYLPLFAFGKPRIYSYGFLHSALRKSLGLDCDIRNEPFVFGGSRCVHGCNSGLGLLAFVVF